MSSGRCYGHCRVGDGTVADVIQKAITSALVVITSTTIIYMAITPAKYNIFSY